MTMFQKVRGKRLRSKSPVGRMRGGRLYPAAVHRVYPSESGILSQEITVELDPVAGRLLTPPWLEIIDVFVPVQALDALLDPAAAYAGMTEVIREKLLAGPIFSLEAEGTISKVADVTPRSIGGVKMVSSAVRLSYIAAVNHLRRLVHRDAAQLLHTSTAIVPALLSETVLDRFNGVLDPDERINGSVALNLPSMELPVKGIGSIASAPIGSATGVKETGGTTRTYSQTLNTANNVRIETTAAAVPLIFAQLNESVGAGLEVNLADFYNAETADRLVRAFEKIAEEHPDYGEEMILRWVHGLSVDPGRMPMVIARRRVPFSRQLVAATDTSGVQDDTMRSDMAISLSLTVAVPPTELGGMIVTLLAVKPDEVLASQPDPDLTVPWELDNHAADELALDPVPVLMRDLDSEVLAGSETTVAFYVGNNHMRRAYSSYGLTRAVDSSTVENKTAIWQLEIPLSVTPNNVIYPETLDHTPFAITDPEADCATYLVRSNLALNTPTIYGPTPVERLAIIDAENLLEE